MRIPAARAASYPRREGNLLRPLVDGLPAFRAIADAVDRATASVWVTVAFLDDDLEMPDGRGTFLAMLGRAARRGLDVRILFWSEPDIAEMLTGSAHFPAGERSFAAIEEHAPGARARWDRLRGYCHHQKSWIVDAGRAGEVAFVGGINLDHDSMVSPGHPPGEAARGPSIHDVYCELRGPSATDVHHNFVQRWNEASERRAPFGAWPSPVVADDLPFPQRASGEAGASAVQVGRTVRPRAYRVGAASPGAAPHAIENGEASILEQYLAAIDAAERTIYLENQILLCPDLFPRLGAALSRGVDVVAVVPARAMPEIARVRRHPVLEPVFAMLEDLGRHANFRLAALGRAGADGSREEIYVHSKVAIVDGEWLTVGSANAMFRSLRDDTEMNVTAWDRAVATGLLAELAGEHSGGSGGGDDDRDLLRGLAERAVENRERMRSGLATRGQVFAIDPAEWAQPGE